MSTASVKTSQAEERKVALDAAAYEEILGALMQGVAVFDAENRLRFHNDRFIELLNFPDGFIHPGKSFESIIAFNQERGITRHDSPTETMDDIAGRITRREGAFRSEIEMPGGHVLALRHVPLADGGFVNTYTRITSRSRAEEKARETLELLQTILANMADGIRVFDENMKLVAFNDQSFDMMALPHEMRRIGLSFEELVAYNHGRGDYKNDHSDDEKSMRDRLERARKGIGRSSTVALPDGRVIAKSRNKMPRGGFITTYTDITRLQSTEAALEEKARALEAAMNDLRASKERAELANRSKSEFLANMSHELRTPLNAIIGFAELICEELKGPVGVPCYKEYAGDIRDSGMHLLNIINDLLDISKIEAGKAELREEMVDIGRVFDSCITLVMERAKGGDVKINQGGYGKLPNLRADSRMIKQVVLNLVSNAVKFTQPGGKVSMDAWRDHDGSVVIAVTDTGIGIAAEDIPRAMKPFAQIDNRLGRRFEGTGLGLPLANSMVKLHGGELEIESTPGHGTKVTVRLPADRVIESAA